MKKWAFVTLFVVFALLLTTRIFIPLKTGQKPLILEQVRPSVPPPCYETTAEKLLDEERFSAVIEMLSEQNGMPASDVRSLVLTTLHNIQTKIPFHFCGEYYNVLCLPEPTKQFEVHKRLHLADSSLGVPIYLDVRVYDAPKEVVLHQLFSSLEGTFEERQCEEGYCFVGRGKRIFRDTDPTHGFAAAQGERGLYFHLKEKDEKVYVAYTEAPWTDFEKIQL
ncbi:MAG: hypothetical protein H7A36_07290 [Chlamydiales bacterium]|nr:hypothetical protein [Chlamydiales bacterium]